MRIRKIAINFSSHKIDKRATRRDSGNTRRRVEIHRRRDHFDHRLGTRASQLHATSDAALHNENSTKIAREVTRRVVRPRRERKTDYDKHAFIVISVRNVAGSKKRTQNETRRAGN